MTSRSGSASSWKLSDLVDSGSDAKPLLMQGLVFVNGGSRRRGVGLRQATW